MNVFLSALAFVLFCSQASVFASPQHIEYQLNCNDQQENNTCRITCVIALAPDIVAAIVPAPLLMGNESCTLSISKITDEKNNPVSCKLFAKEALTGLALFKLEKKLSTYTPTKDADSYQISKGEKLQFSLQNGEIMEGICIGMEHTCSGINFPLPLLRVQFPLSSPPIMGQACFTKNGDFAGMVIGMSPKGGGHILPAEAIRHLLQNPKAKRIRLGCLLDINGSSPEIIGLVNGGPLQKAGVHPNDILLSINQYPIDTYDDFLKATYYIPANTSVTIKIIRNTEIVEIKDIQPAQEDR